MSLIHSVESGTGPVPIVFVHGFGCALNDWEQQVAHLSPCCRTVAVDLPAHGVTPGMAEGCTIEGYGAEVAKLLWSLNLPPAVLVGHSMGCRVVTEAALQAPAHTAALILVDGSQFSPIMGPVMKQCFASAEGYRLMVHRMFTDMFTAKSDPATVAAVVARAALLPATIGARLLTDLLRYDVGRFSAALASLRVPVMALQSTYSNETRERSTLRPGQSSPFLAMLTNAVASVSIEIVADTGHFPQLDEPAETNALIERFIALLAECSGQNFPPRTAF